MALPLSSNTTFMIESCIVCGLEFAVSRGLYEARQRDRKVFYCPAGHEMLYNGPNKDAEIANLKSQLDAANRRTNFERERRQSSELELKKSKTRLVTMKKRIGNGVCPCCNRHFENLQRHMNEKHVQFGKEKL